MIGAGLFLFLLTYFGISVILRSEATKNLLARHHVVSLLTEILRLRLRMTGREWVGARLLCA